MVIHWLTLLLLSPIARIRAFGHPTAALGIVRAPTKIHDPANREPASVST